MKYLDWALWKLRQTVFWRKWIRRECPHLCRFCEYRELCDLWRESHD